VTTKFKRYDLRRSPAAPKATENSEQDDSTNRRNKDRGEVEPFSVLEAQKTADEEAADKRSDDADDQIGQQSVIAAGNPFGQPAGEDTNDDAGYDVQKQPPVRETPALEAGSFFVRLPPVRRELAAALCERRKPASTA
jgi:hypothetical protein